MGTELATDLVHNNHQDAEQKLWRHVILNALEDASVDLNDRKSAVISLKLITGLLKIRILKRSVGGLLDLN